MLPSVFAHSGKYKRASIFLLYAKTRASRYSRKQLAEVAQLVEHLPEEEGVAGSSPALGTCCCLLSGAELFEETSEIRELAFELLHILCRA